MRLNYLICALLLAVSTPALSQTANPSADTLVPGDNATLGRSPFPSAVMPDVRVRTMIWQQAGGQYSETTGIKLRAGAYYIFYDRNPRFDWADVDAQNMKPNETIYREIPVSAALGKSIEGLWNGMLAQSRPQPASASGNATIFVTSLTGDKPVTAVLKNFTGPKTKGFYGLVDAMGQACIERDKASLAALTKQVNALAGQLK